MVDEQEMIRCLLSNSLSDISRELTSETLTFDRMDSLQYGVDWLYHTTVRNLDTGIIDARIVRCLREAREFLYGSRSGGLSASCQAQQIFTGARGRPVNSRTYRRYDWTDYQSILLGIASLLPTKKRLFDGQKVDAPPC